MLGKLTSKISWLPFLSLGIVMIALSSSDVQEASEAAREYRRVSQPVIEKYVVGIGSGPGTGMLSNSPPEPMTTEERLELFSELAHLRFRTDQSKLGYMFYVQLFLGVALIGAAGLRLGRAKRAVQTPNAEQGEDANAGHAPT